jgi:PDZ domain
VTRTWMVIVAAVLAGVAAPAAAQNDSSGPTGRGAAASSPDGWLGMGISCGPCSFQRTSGRRGRWDFSTPPTVFSVDPDGPADRAGLRAGDTLIAINGEPFTSAGGGEAFGTLRPGQAVVLRYQRGGTSHDARLTAVARPARDQGAVAERLQALATQDRERERQAEQIQRRMRETQRQLRTQREYLATVMTQMERARAEAQVSDTARREAIRRYLATIDSAAASWRAAELLYALQPPPALPAAPAAPPTPIAAAPPETPVAAAPPPPAPPTAADWERDAGPLRYSGSLGDVTIEARAAGAVTTTEVSDSEVVVTSHDLSVRIAIPPRPPRPARARRPPPAHPRKE